MWFFFALSFALITSLSMIIAKRVMKELNEYTYLFLSGFFAIPFLFFIIKHFFQIPQIDRTFILSISIGVTIGVVAAAASYRAIRISEVSLVSSISAFNPVFTALISFIVLGESIGLRGLWGIALVCLGAYLLELSKLKNDLLAPFKNLLGDRGVQLSLLAYFLWAITPIFEKTAIKHTYPEVPPFASFAGLGLSTVIFFAVAFKPSKIPVKVIKKFIPIFLLLGVLGALGQTSAMIAFSSTNLGFATAIFKLSIIFTVIFGWLFFKEKNIKDRLLGSVVMLGGVLLLVT